MAANVFFQISYLEKVVNIFCWKKFPIIFQNILQNSVNLPLKTSLMPSLYNV
jgi:hypothetical protein